MRRAKIVCTLGPATDSYEQIKALVEAGMDVARFNLSHGTYADHEARYERVRKASEETGRSVGVLADLQGPKIRLGRFREGPVLLERGDTFTITVRPGVEGDRHRCGTTYEGLAADVTPGERVLVDDGKVTLEVTGVQDTEVHTTVVEGGMVSDHKGLNLPGVAVSVPALSEKDREDLRWALRTGADIIALSFVRSGADIDDVHRIMREENRFRPVIAKVEKPQAVDAIDDIVAAFDGIMVARGDLGVEMPLETVPVVQKRAITLARRNAKPVIVATQMLDSMIENSRPTRAEASDVANAVIDGTDAVMLSGETSVGKYATETVRTMARIVTAAEEDILTKGLPPLTDRNKPRTQGGAAPAPPPRWATSSAPSSSSPSPSPATPSAASPATVPPSPSSPSPPNPPPAPSSTSPGAWKPSSVPRSTPPTKWSPRWTRNSCASAAANPATPSSSRPAHHLASPARRTSSGCITSGRTNRRSSLPLPPVASVLGPDVRVQQRHGARRATETFCARRLWRARFHATPTASSVSVQIRRMSADVLVKKYRGYS